MPATTPPAASPVHWTRAMFEALPDDGQRHEIIDGAHYVTPSPGRPHQVIIGELFVALHAFLKAHPVGSVILSPFDILLADDTIVEPDLVVMARTDGPPPDRASGEIPILAVEVLSPSTRSRDRIIKRPRYQRAGIAEYWVVDAESRLVERWTPADQRPEIITDVLRWRPAGAESELAIELAPIFDLGEPADA